MAIMMITEQAGAGPEVLDDLREHGVFDKMKSAPGFMGHWNGTTESPEAHQAWFEANIKPILPPDADAGYCSTSFSPADGAVWEGMPCRYRGVHDPAACALRFMPVRGPRDQARWRRQVRPEGPLAGLARL